VAQVGCGSWCWAIGADPQSIMHGVIIHELGHNLSFNHARTDQNNNGYNSSESTDSEYGDNSDMMGSSRNWKKFNPPHAEDKGWVDPVEFEIMEVTPGSSVQSFDLLPLDEEAWDWPGLRALKLERSSNTDYYVSYRRQAGDYNNLNSPYHNRVNIYYGFDNSTYSYFVTALAAGESFTDTARDFVITVTSPVPLSEGALSTTAMGVEICQQSCSSTPAPSSLSATAQSTSTIQLAWNDNSDSEDGFDIQRSPDGSSWSAVTTVAPDSTNYTDVGLDVATTYSYQVRASSPIQDSGWSNVASAQTFGIPPIADFSFFENFLDVDFTDLSGDSDGSIVAWSWNFGDGGSSSAQNPSYSYASAGTRSVSLTVTDDDGESDSVSKDVTVVEPPPPPFTDHGASGDIPVAGSVSGNYAATAADDGSVQSITERESGGKKNSRYSYGEHRWTFSLPSGGTEVTVSVNAWQSESSDGDTFDFAWSPNGSTWVRMFNIAGTSDGAPVTFALPEGTGGTVYIRVKDTDQTKGNRSKDTVYVDFLQIRVSNMAPEPLNGSEPTLLSAIATSYDTVELSWTDNTSNEAGFIIERSKNGGAYVELGSPAPANAGSTASFTDMGLTENTNYDYRIYAFKGGDSTAYSNIASVTTGFAPAISITLSGYKVKGKQKVDLTWDGATSSNVDIVRDGSVVMTTANDNAYTDNIDAKGGATYVYQVCEENSGSACSDPKSVVF
jgi:PKD repeat protein